MKEAAGAAGQMLTKLVEDRESESCFFETTVCERGGGVGAWVFPRRLWSGGGVCLSATLSSHTWKLIL